MTSLVDMLENKLMCEKWTLKEKKTNSSFLIDQAKDKAWSEVCGVVFGFLTYVDNFFVPSVTMLLGIS